MDDRGNIGTSSSASGGGEVRIAIRDGRHDGRARRHTLLYKLLALVLVVGSAGYLISLYRDSSKADDSASQNIITDSDRASAERLVADEGSSRTALVSARAREPETHAGLERELSRDLSEFHVPGEPVPTMKEVIARLNEAGIHSGLGAFSPPGTSPPLVGLAVPEDFALPEGYVRHSQATDDGQPIEAILMFSPDFEFFDAAGQPIAIPPNHVVPPELAPPGLPIRRISIPRPL